MGAKGPKEIVSPTEWVRRTSLTFKKRSADTLMLDQAYAEWSANPSRTAAAINLHKVLRDYLKTKGGVWSKVERDKVSGGLIEWVYNEVQKVPGVMPPPVSPAQAALQNVDIPHSRYGVLYLLGNIDIDMSVVAISLEGVAAMGNVAGQALSVNYGQLGNEKLGVKKIEVPVVGQQLKTGTISSGGALAVKKLGAKIEGTVDPATQARHHVLKPPPKRPEPGFPCTLAMYELVKDDPALMLNPFTIGATVAVTAVAGVLEALNSLRIVLQNAVTDLVHYILEKVANPSAKTLATLGATVKGMIKFMVSKCLVSAVPFVDAGMKLAGGVIQTFKAAKERLGAWLERRKIVLNPGHPEMLADAIQNQMDKGIFAGLWTLLKAVADTALNALLPAAGALVAAIVTGIEWLVKLIWRLIEQSQISDFLTKAREAFLKERALTTQTSHIGAHRVMPSQGAAYHNVVEHAHRGPNLDKHSGGIIHNLDEFKKLFQTGCNASPLVPMIVLNSGICGSLMVLLKMFDDLNRPLTTQAMYDTGNEYFTRLKRYSRDYMAKSGFQFKVKLALSEADYGWDFKKRDNEARYLRGLLNHSLRDHGGIETKTDKLLAFVAGSA